MPTLIYCAERNARFTEIARRAGFEIGARLPNRIYSPPLYFADQDWKNPDRESYMRELARYRPHMATVLDWEHDDQLGEVLAWAEEAARFVSVVLIVPKVIGGVSRLPRCIGGKTVHLAYSVPTRFGGTSVPIWEFAGWPVHLLGGSPHAQMVLARYLNVASVDGNMANRMAQCCRFWSSKKRRGDHWTQLGEWGRDANAEAFRRSCENISAAWRAVDAASGG